MLPFVLDATFPYFNFNNDKNTPHLDKQDYEICIRREIGKKWISNNLSRKLIILSRKLIILSRKVIISWIQPLNRIPALVNLRIVARSTSILKPVIINHSVLTTPRVEAVRRHHLKYSRQITTDGWWIGNLCFKTWVKLERRIFRRS